MPSPARWRARSGASNWPTSSTLFLDEIGDLPADVQVKLLRVLEERQVERLGSPQTDARGRAHHRRDAPQPRAARSRTAPFARTCSTGSTSFRFRSRRCGIGSDDIPLLVWRFVDEFSRSFGKRIDSIAEDNMRALQQYAWPGNIRELRNVVERAMIVDDRSATHHRAAETLRDGARQGSVEAAGHRDGACPQRILESSNWRIRGAGGAAERLGLKPTTLETRMAKLGLTRPKH